MAAENPAQTFDPALTQPGPAETGAPKIDFAKEELLEDYDRLWEMLKVYEEYFGVDDENGCGNT